MKIVRVFMLSLFTFSVLLVGIAATSAQTHDGGSGGKHTEGSKDDRADCLACHGTGKCNPCRGTGKLFCPAKERYLKRDGTSGYRTCSRCGGTGARECDLCHGDKDCTACGGQGKR